MIQHEKQEYSQANLLSKWFLWNTVAILELTAVSSDAHSALTEQDFWDNILFLIVSVFISQRQTPNIEISNCVLFSNEQKCTMLSQ